MSVTLFLLATLVAPVVVSFALRRTPLWWLASVCLAAYGAYLVHTVDHGSHGHEVVDAWGNLGNVMQHAYGIALIVYALLIAIVTNGSWHAWRHMRREKQARFPTATVL